MALAILRESARPSDSLVSHQLDVSNEDEIFDLNDFENELKRLAAANRDLMDVLHTDDDVLPPADGVPNDIAVEGDVIYDGNDAAASADSVDAFEEELKRLAEINHQLINHYCPDDGILQEVSREVQSPTPETIELVRLQQENSELKTRVRELEEKVKSLSNHDNGDWSDRQREYEVLLEEKSEVIRGFHQTIQELREISASNEAASAAKGGEENGEVLRLKRELEEQRYQLTQDENDMMAQLRHMEMTMAKERADMARQRQEIERLKEEVAREIELAGRNPGLRDRLQHLSRSQDSFKPTPAVHQSATPSVTQEAANQPAPHTERKSVGFYRRIFG